MTLSPGDKMPFCAGMASDRQFYSFDAQAGRVAVLVLAAECDAILRDALIAALAAHQAELAEANADLLALLGPRAGMHACLSGPDTAAGVRLVVCQDAFFALCDPHGEAPLVVVMDRAARVVACWPGGVLPPVALAAAALAVVVALGREPPLPAPVLAVPRLLTPALCDRLIAGFDSGAHFDSGVTGMDAAGRPHTRLDPGKKRRRDWLLEPGDGFYEPVLDALSTRLVPEILRAFQHQVTNTDRVLVARYDDTGGYFHRHRDNTGVSVAFRQFALSLNLNAEAYEGGNLLFPEFNDHRYRPGTGEGLVFSASLLHEATPVTRGVRYVLLTFLHDAAAEASRPTRQTDRAEAAA